MLPNAPITLNVGDPATDVVFDTRVDRGDEAVFYAASPNGDLGGRIKLRVSHETTKSGIVRSLVQFNKPVLDANGNYSRSITANATIIRSDKESTADVDEVLEMLQEVFAVTDFRAAIVEALN